MTSEIGPVYKQDVVIHPIVDIPVIQDVQSPDTLKNENVGQPDFQALIDPAFPKSAVIYEEKERTFEPIFSVSPPPPEPLPWTASAREWSEWVGKRDRYIFFVEQRALDEKALIGTF